MSLITELGDSIALAKAAERSGVSLQQARRLISELAAMPMERLVRVIMAAGVRR